MHVIFDHLTAILIGSVLLIALFVVQRRSQTTSIEATERYRTETQAAEFLKTVERDIENIRTVAQTQHAFGTHRLSLRQAVGTDGEQYTQQFSFPTLADPSLGTASPVVIVTYHIEPAGESAQVGDQLRPLYSATRYVTARGGTPQRTGGALRLVDFDITAFFASGAEVTSASQYWDTPTRLNVEIEAAAPMPSNNGSSTLRATRQARLVRVLGAAARGGLPPVDPSTPAGIPELPGDPPPPPPAPPPPPPPSGGGSGPGPGPAPPPPTGPTEPEPPPPPGPDPSNL
jgi:hypothetical protein